MIDLDNDLPRASNKRIAVNITADALRQVRGGHPWVWDGSITKISALGKAGDLAVIFGDKREFVGIGLWDPDAAIAVRMLHAGSPRTIDDTFFADRLLESVARRQPLHDDPSTTGYRLVHGENDGLPGLVVDRYDRTLVLKLDSPVWVPHLRSLVPPLVDLADAERLVLRASRRIEQLLAPPLRNNPTLVGNAPTAAVEFLENGLLFEADVERGQKTGHFLDQRDNRLLLGDRCGDASVLDLFCNTGGFSVYAAAGGARSVHSIDVSHHAVEATNRHIERNRERRGYKTVHTALVADAFDAMADLVAQNRRFDVVVVDPPSFAPNAAAVPAALRAYQRLTSMAVDLLASGGTLLQASCSSRISSDEFHHLVSDEIQAAGFQEVDAMRTAHDLDHPIGFPHGAYLKATLTGVAPAR